MKNQKNKISVCFGIDNNYAKHCMVTILSILRNSDSNFHFYILNADLTEKNRNKIKEIKKIKDFEISFIDVNENDFDNCKIFLDCHISPATYYRLKIASLLPNLDKVIYLDSDIVANKDLKELENISFDGAYILGCRAMTSEENSNRLNLLQKDRYVNAGVLVFNLKKIREDNIEDKFFKCVNENYKILVYNDQDVINLTLFKFKNGIKYIDQNWNTEIRTDVPFKEGYLNIVKKPYIIHFITADKPWNIDSKQLYREKYWKYYKELNISEKMNNLTTVIITCHNYGKFLKECIDSVLNQTVELEEIIVIDDASNDNSEEVARSYGDKIKYFKVNFKNGQKTRNFGLEKATGKYLFYLDADDYINNNCIELLQDELEKDDSLSLAYMDCKYFGDPEIMKKYGVKKYGIRREFNYEELKRENYIDTCSLVVRKGFKGFDESFKRFQDWDAWLTFLKDKKAKYVNEVLIAKRFHGENITLNNSFTPHMVKLFVKHGFEDIIVSDYERFEKDLLKANKNNHKLNIVISELNFIIKEMQNSFFWKIRNHYINLKNKIKFIMFYPKNFFKKYLFKRKNKQSLVSVIIPIYDRVEELRESIDSILNQTYKNIELILITDGSPKKTLEIVNKYEELPQVRAFYYKNNTGNAVRGRNKGIKESKGEYIAFQDSDDIADKDRIKISVKYIKKYKVDVVYGGWKALIDDTRVDTGLKNGQKVMSPNCDFDMLKKMCVPCQSTVMANKKALLDVGGLKNKMKYREDHELWVRLAYFGYKFKSIPKVLTNLRLHEGNNELNFKNNDDKWMCELEKEYKFKQDLNKIKNI